MIRSPFIVQIGPNNELTQLEKVVEQFIIL